MDEGSFKAEITIKPQSMERVFEEVPIEVLNLDSSLEIKDELPTVMIKLAGTMPVLEDYVLTKHTVQVNLREVNAPGEYEIPLRYILPANLQLIEKSDDEIIVTVIKKAENQNDNSAVNTSGDNSGAQ